MGNTDTAAIVRLNMAYTQSKILHGAVEVGLFELLAEGPATAARFATGWTCTQAAA